MATLESASILIGQATSTELMIIYTIILFAYLLYKNKKRQAFFSAASMVVVGLITKSLKLIIEMPRRIQGLAESYAFPSGHSAGAAAFALIIYYAFKDEVSERILVPACVLLALLIGLSRVVAGYHRLVEVVVGWALGAGLVYALYTVLINRNDALNQ